MRFVRVPTMRTAPLFSFILLLSCTKKEATESPPTPTATPTPAPATIELKVAGASDLMYAMEEISAADEDGALTDASFLAVATGASLHVFSIATEGTDGTIGPP